MCLKIHTLGKNLKSLTCSEFPPSYPYAALPLLCLIVTSTAPSVFYGSSSGNDIQRPIEKNTPQQCKDDTLLIWIIKCLQKCQSNWKTYSLHTSYRHWPSFVPIMSLMKGECERVSACTILHYSYQVIVA